jgi:ribosomal protein S18 acetylase RimI-like enzyme
MIDLTQALRASGQMVYPIAADLYEELADPGTQASVRLWEDASHELAGFVYVSQYQNLVDVFEASQFNSSIETEMMGWAAAAVQLRSQEKGERLTLDASAREADLPRLAFLERNGFKPHPEASILMARPLDLPVPEPVLPAGFSIRPMGGEAEIEAYVALHRAAFGTGNMTVAHRRAIMSTPSYIPALDLVAAAPNGELAAFCVCQIFPDDKSRGGGHKEGWTDPIGTHPAYQRLGLAKALILTGMRLLKARGLDTALLGTNSENNAMQHTAKAVGFRIVSNTLWYSKPV